MKFQVDKFTRIEERYELKDTFLTKLFGKEKKGQMECIWGFPPPSSIAGSSYASLLEDGFYKFLLNEDTNNLARKLRSEYDLAWTIFKDTDFQISPEEDLDPNLTCYKISDNRRDCEVKLIIFSQGYMDVVPSEYIALGAKYKNLKEFELTKHILAAAKKFFESKSNDLLSYYGSGAHLQYAASKIQVTEKEYQRER